MFQNQAKSFAFHIYAFDDLFNNPSVVMTEKSQPSVQLLMWHIRQSFPEKVTARVEISLQLQHMCYSLYYSPTSVINQVDPPFRLDGISVSTPCGKMDVSGGKLGMLSKP